MTFEDYNKVIQDFKGLRFYHHGDPDFYKSHFKLIGVFIKTTDGLRKCFERHSETSDVFPSHIDLKKSLNELLNQRANTKPIADIFDQSIKSIDKRNFIRVHNPNKTVDAQWENSLSDKMWHLESAKVNKQLVLVACKKDFKYCAKIKKELDLIEEEIEKLKKVESEEKQIKQDVPF